MTAARDPRYDILFEPVRIGPVTSRNRFYQVPHCNGMGHAHPLAMAGMRAVKAEGGWGVVSTEECEISPKTDLSPYVEARLWDDGDIPGLRAMAEGVKAHGALAAIELAFNGYGAPNRTTREIPLAPSNTPVRAYDPIQARAMDLADIRELRAAHRQAALRAKRAGFDIVYVYAGHELALPFHFLSRRHNRRDDAYGGRLENRMRLLRELIEDTRDAVGDVCAVAVRLAVDELRGADGLEADGEGRDIVASLAELPDLWDVNISDWSRDSATARFESEGYQEKYISFVKGLTTKPVVGVGRYTSPDAMASLVRRGVMDLIGAARPSIADPFLPRKIEQGRLAEIRECIGCNICVSGDSLSTPIRCTQNPTMGEEWRRGWHPERIAPAPSPERVLVVGAGPAGLECARALGARGYEVALAEAGRELGGRVLAEARLPGLATWARVVDHRLEALSRLPNVEIFRESRLTAQDVLDFGAAHVVLACGARWRRDGTGRANWAPVEGLDQRPVFTPDDMFAGAAPGGRVVIYDDDHYYMGGVLAELLVRRGAAVRLVTPAPDASNWTHNTLEQGRIQARLLEQGVEICPGRRLEALTPEGVTLSCVYTGRPQTLGADAVVMVTARDPVDELYRALVAEGADQRLASLRRTGDGLAPGTIAAAIYWGHRIARETGLAEPPPMRRERRAVD